ncbi:MAG TPA: DUF3800 domain-containing protein [Candidatus Spyradenecus faecavium]|uniref:DUF3800 domain-containing protein n=1 Tax=Candidatus Spyradenecus faecavium TaxID=2840947 RepID=A0A9D1NPC4_9BACT|nr:DUF3800 domain-containing protein [Candidatus Spyradenecus faecavium]
MYLFYIDESGNRDFSHLEKERFYILTAVGMYENHWKRFHFDITRFKQSIIDRIMRDEGIKLDVSTDAEVKSTYLRNPKERDKHPFSKFQTDTERLKLSSMFYDQLKQCKAVLISAVIDKQAILPNSHLADQKAIHLKAWELLCERIERYMTEAHPKHKAILITDDTGKQRNLQTTTAQITFYERGATSGLHFKHIIEMPLFVRSETCEGVQLADLCCYNVYRRFSQDDPDYPFYKRIAPFFYNSDNTDKEKVDGLKIFPPTSPFAKK